jgi:GDP-L-fucose synthase
MNKILVTGGSGLVGNAFKNKLVAYYPDSKELNLLDRKQVFNYFKNKEIDTVIHIAGKVGGVGANTNFMSDFYSQNIQMNTNIIDACIENKISKLVCCLSTCIYPDEGYVSYPLTEQQLHLGPPHQSNFGYAYAKRMVDIQLKAARQQHNVNYISVVPNNVYGEHDNFDLENGHVLPCLTRKIWEAKINNKSHFYVWGDGEVYREFTYSDDIVNAILFCLKNYNEIEPINIGNTLEHKLKDVIALICKELEYEGDIIFDVSKPKGQIRKPTSNSKFINLGWKSEWYTTIEQGVKNTCEWFKQNYPNVRGV